MLSAGIAGAHMDPPNGEAPWADQNGVKFSVPETVPLEVGVDALYTGVDEKVMVPATWLTAMPHDAQVGNEVGLGPLTEQKGASTPDAEGPGPTSYQTMGDALLLGVTLKSS